MIAEAVGPDPVRVTVFLHADNGPFGLMVSCPSDPEGKRVLIRRSKVRVISEHGFYAQLELSRDMAMSKGLINIEIAE